MKELVKKSYGTKIIYRCIQGFGNSDPYSFDPDPDPVFEAGDQSGSRALMTKNWKKITAEIFFFKSKTAIYLSLGIHKVCPSYRRSLQLTKEAIQHFKT